MTMWLIIMWTVIAFVMASLFYLGIKVPTLFPKDYFATWNTFKQFSLGLLLTLGVSGILVLCIDFINAFVCVMYLAMIWAVTDFIFWLIGKTGLITFSYDYSGLVAGLVSLSVLGIGWYLAHNVWQKNYELTTSKDVPNLKIAMFADSHIGTTFDDKGFAKHLKQIEAQNPDLIVVVGDYVDDGTTKDQMINATRALGKVRSKYGVYYVAGNHDKGYYGAAHRGFSERDLFKALKDNGIKVLQDENVVIADAFNLIGRRDFSEVKERGGQRHSIDGLMQNADPKKYSIVLDHQPVEFDKDADANVDLVLCGHTHGGQLFPFNQVGKLIKANDLVYGHERRQNTDFIVTSGIADWAIKFKTGTKSEFVIINIRKESNNV